MSYEALCRPTHAYVHIHVSVSRTTIWQRKKIRKKIAKTILYHQPKVKSDKIWQLSSRVQRPRQTWEEVCRQEWAGCSYR